MMRKAMLAALTVSLATLLAVAARAASPVAEGTRGMVVSPHHEASVVGRAILQAGGNASQVVSELQSGFVSELLARFPDVRIRWEGQQEETNESVRSLVIGYLV